MVFEIIEILFIFSVIIVIWLQKGGSIKGFIKMIIIFLVATALLSISLDHFESWKKKKQERIKEENIIQENIELEKMKERLQRMQENILY